MSISAMFGSSVLVLPISSGFTSFKRGGTKIGSLGGGSGGLLIECSSRPQKKATAHHMKTRPRKSQGWDRRRKPTVYAPLPPLPPDWSLEVSGDASSQVAVELAPPPPPAPPITE